MKHPISRKTSAALNELEHESTRMAACLCAAVDALHQAETYAARKGSPVQFTTDNASSIGLALYIRRRDEAKTGTFPKSSKKLVRDTEAPVDASESRRSAHDVTDGARHQALPDETLL